MEFPGPGDDSSVAALRLASPLKRLGNSVRRDDREDALNAQRYRSSFEGRFKDGD